MPPVTDRILLIEDDNRLAEMVRDYLDGAGFRATRAATGAAGLALHAREAFDAIVLDLMLPDIDGLEVCRQVRARSATPILMLTARGDAMDRVVGLEMGADDYLPKPFEPRELLARLRAILRRGKTGPKDDILRFGRLEIDRGAREVRLDGRGPPDHRLSVRSAAGAGGARRARHVARGPDGNHEGERPWRPSTAPSMCTCRASEPPSKTIPRSRAGS